MREHEIWPVFHYVPLHSASAGRKFGRFYGEDVYTTRDSERLMRLPMYYELTLDDVTKVTETMYKFPEWKKVLG